jgi:monovalent cation:H+ antiporter-2, CPA2 family
VVEQARAANPGLVIMARAHSQAAVDHLDALGATLTILGEREIAHRMLENALDVDIPAASIPAAVPELAGAGAEPQQREERPSANSSRQAP